MQTRKLALVKYLIRQKVKEVLVDKTEAKCNVFVSRTTNLDHEELPAILIYPDNERVEVFNKAPKDYQRTFSCKIEIVGVADDDGKLDLLLETIAEQIEFLLEVNETEDKTFGKLIDSLAITGSQYSFSGEGQTPTGSLILTVDFNYFASSIPEGLDLADFKGVNINWKVGHHDSSPDTGDNLDVDGDGDDGSVKAQNTINLPGV